MIGCFSSLKTNFYCKDEHCSSLLFDISLPPIIFYESEGILLTCYHAERVRQRRGFCCDCIIFGETPKWFLKALLKAKAEE